MIDIFSVINIWMVTKIKNKINVICVFKAIIVIMVHQADIDQIALRKL
jgi:hypothetical protein